MKRYWFKSTLWIALATTFALTFINAFSRDLVLAQEATPGQTDVLITVTYTEQINVRDGPSTVLYNIIGHLQPGETARAIGVSPGRDWVQIEFPSGPDGKAWVHTGLISLSPGTLRIIEPPPTATPRVTQTVDPTLAAAYIFEPTVTRMPRFTPPPPLEIPEFTQMPVKQVETGMPVGAIVLSLGIPGLLGYIFVSLRRR